MKYCKDCKRFEEETNRCKFELCDTKLFYDSNIGKKIYKMCRNKDLEDNIREEIKNKLNINPDKVYYFYFTYFDETNHCSETLINVLNKDNDCKFYEKANWFVRLLRK